jgi:hypothetical protein
VTLLELDSGLGRTVHREALEGRGVDFVTRFG